MDMNRITRPLTLVALLFCLTFTSCTKLPQREIISLNGEWRFFVDSSKVFNSENLEEKEFPEKLTRIVTVPHAWNADKGLEKYWGRCWYQRDIRVSADQLLKTTRLQFDAVYHDAIIYINGNKAGEHLGSGYNRFFVDISNFLKAGINRLTVCVDNSPSTANIPFLRSFDWANDGGIYRNVYEITTEKQAICNIHVVATPKGSKGMAVINVNFIDSSVIDESKISLIAEITEENQPAKKQIFQGKLKGQFDKACFTSQLSFKKINPWHFDSPNLYKITVKLYYEGTMKDEYSTVFGFRSIKVENYRYVLNGEPIRLMGVEWMPGSSLEHGMAENSSDLEKNLILMKNANCIFTRFHWQQDENIFDWCDRHGILVQEEIPYWGGSTIINDTLLKIGIQQLDEMIDAHFNHPSIIMWGIGNELQSHIQENISSLKILYNYAKNTDSSRLVSYVSNNLNWGFPGDKKELPDATSDFDMMMFNEYYSTWYGKSIDIVPSVLDRIAEEYPGKALTISEWGICEPVHKGGDPRRAREMVQQVKIYGSKPYIAGAIYFCLNDYRTHMGEDSTYSYPQRVHGVCDIRLNPKPSYDTLKFISSPLEIRRIVQKEGVISLTLFGKTGIPSYSIHNYSIEAGNEKSIIQELIPGEEKTFEIKTNSKEIGIYRPTGFEVIHIRLK
jgi:beta-galactosidase